MTSRRRRNTGRADAEYDTICEKKWQLEYEYDAICEKKRKIEQELEEDKEEQQQEIINFPIMIEDTVEGVSISMINEEGYQIDIMDDGRFFVFVTTDTVYEYKNKKDYNKDRWSIRGFIHKDTHQPSGECSVFDEHSQSVNIKYF